MDHGTPRVPFMLEFDYIEDESDEDRRGQDSSEDELDIILHGTPKQKRKLTRSLSRGSLELSSSEDEFEKDMEKELNETMRLHEEQYTSKDGANSSGIQMDSSASGSTAQGASAQQNGEQDPSLAHQFYHDIYFDSDDSDSANEGEGKKKDKKQKVKHRVMTDDELLYDPNIDDENQRWVDRQRQKYRNQQQRKTPPTNPAGTDTAVDTSDTVSGPAEDVASLSAPPKPKSDAVLNCPACITTLCLDCQQHDLYHNQFRAMFVLNCSIVRSERLKYPVPKKSKRWNKRNRGKRRREEAGEGSSNMEKAGEEDSEELYFPVKCSVCNTEVGVYDEDEVFHFFNVLASTA